MFVIAKAVKDIVIIQQCCFYCETERAQYVVIIYFRWVQF